MNKKLVEIRVNSNMNSSLIPMFTTPLTTINQKKDVEIQTNNINSQHIKCLSTLNGNKKLTFIPSKKNACSFYQFISFQQAMTGKHKNHISNTMLENSIIKTFNKFGLSKNNSSSSITEKYRKNTINNELLTKEYFFDFPKLN